MGFVRARKVISRIVVVAALTSASLSLVAAPAHAAASVCDASPDTTWNGSVSTDWFDVANWDVRVPLAGDNVCVPGDMPFNPLISASRSAEVATLEVAIGATLNINGASLQINGNSSIATLTLSGANTSLINNGDLTVDTAFNMTQGAVTGTGSITTVIGANFATTSPKTIYQDFTNVGILTWNDGDVDFSTNTVTNNGQWRVPGNNDTIIASDFINAGTLTKSNSGIFTINANFTNSGQTNISGGSTFVVSSPRTFTVTGGGVSANGGTVDRTGANITITGGRTYTDSTGFIRGEVTVAGGILSGDGQYVGNVTVNSGEVTGGDFNVASTGIVTITGNVVFNGGALRADVRGTAAGSGYDRVAVSGTVTINGGQLDARGTGYNPPALSTFDVLTYSTISGTLSLIHDINSSPYSGYYETDYGTSPLTLTARYNGQLNGQAFIDDNSNGVRDGAEGAGRPGVTVYLDVNGNGALDGGEPSRGVDGSGNYTFDNIAPVAYQVRTTGAPFGFVQSTNNPLNRTVPDNGSISANFGFYESITIAGNVFADNNRDGLNNAGDGPANNIAVYLDNNGNGVRDGGEPTVNTNSSGNYAFSGLAPGTYNIRLTVPNGATQTTSNPGPTFVTSGSSVSGINFGVDIISGSIAGTVYVDTNGNGTRDGGENTPVSGTVAFIDANANGILDAGERTTALDVNGAYVFNQLNPGTYNVAAVIPGGFTQTSPAQTNINVSALTAVTGRDIGLFQAPGISGTVFSDANANGIADVNEGRVAGVQVFFDTNNNGILDGGERVTTTNAAGQYNFDAVAGGTYSVRVVVPTPGTQTTASPADITVTSNSGAANIDFGLQVTGNLEGTVFEDLNGNGTREGSETVNLADIEVFLDVNNNGAFDSGEPTATTDADGNYEFLAVPAGDHVLRVTVPTEFVRTTALPTSVTVVANETETGPIVGLFEKTSAAGSVFLDANENGVLDSGEQPAANYDLYIDLNNNGVRDIGEPRATTATDGSFVFEDLGPGPHAIRPLLPANAVTTTVSPLLVSLESNTATNNLRIGLDIYGSISGNIFVDADGNGIRGGGETDGVDGVVVFLDTNNNGVLDAGERSVTTNSNGDYSFNLILQGTYNVVVQVPSGSIRTTNALAPLTVANFNQNLSGNDFGLYFRGSISGTVFFDADANEAFTAGEPGIKGATVYLDINNNSRFDSGEPTVATADNGTYTFNGLAPGSYTVRVIRWNGASQLTPEPASIALLSDAAETGIDFGMDKPVVGSLAPSNQGTGYWMLGSDGRVYSFGEAKDFGSIGEIITPAVGLAPTPTGDGYWVATAGGGVQSFGDARFFGSPSSLRLNAPVIDIVATPSGNGYWVLAADGGVFSYGDAQFFGSTGSMRLNAPVVGMAATGDGRGYWLVAADGGVFAYGNAAFRGSMGGRPLNQPVVGIIGTSTGDGYLLVAADGGMFVYDAPFLGSAANLKLDAPIVGVKARGDGRGYWLVGEDGGLFAYGQAPFYGNAKTTKTSPIVN